jgi:outer membrane protein TolC
VKALVQDRQQTALGYRPDATPATTAPTKTARRDYAKVPTTAQPPLSEDPILLRTIRRQSLPLGPTLPAPGTAATLPANDGLQRADRYVTSGYTVGPPVELARGPRLNLFDCVHYAVNHSRQYQDSMESLYEAALDVTLQRHLFTPRPFANVRARYDGGQADVNYRSALTVTGQAGVRQRLPYGGEIVASALVDFVNALNDTTQDGENARLALTATVPLLRGAGMVNLEGLISSERRLVYAVREFESFRRDFVIRVSTQYFQLLTRQQALRNRYLRYLDNVELTARTEALFAAGTISALEVQRSQQELLTSEDDVNRAVQVYENAVDDFKLVIGMPVEEDLHVIGVALDVVDPDLDIGRITNTARAFRLDLQTGRDRVEDARRQVDYAKNDLLPDLTLSAQSGLRNPDNTAARRVDSDTLDYSAELRLDLPVDRLQERNQYRSALINLQSAQRNVEDLEQSILADMRQAARAIRSAQTTLELSRRGIEIARQRLDFANESLLSGRTTESRNVVEAQNSLLQAQDRYEQARADLQVQVLQYLRDTGQLRLDPASGQLGVAMERDAITR